MRPSDSPPSVAIRRAVNNDESTRECCDATCGCGLQCVAYIAGWLVMTTTASSRRMYSGRCEMHCEWRAARRGEHSKSSLRDTRISVSKPAHEDRLDKRGHALDVWGI